MSNSGSSTELVPLVAASSAANGLLPAAAATAAARELISTAQTVNFIQVTGGINNNSSNAAAGGAHSIDDHEAVIQHIPEGTKLGKCFYDKCANKQIFRDYGPTGENVSYYVCSNACGDVCVHDSCLERFSMQPENVVTEIRRPCAKCGHELRIATEVAVWRAVVYWFFGWPWWFLTRFSPTVIVAGYLFKLWWFVNVVYARYPIDTWNNPAVVELNSSSGDPIVTLPRLSIAAFGAYNYCKPSNLDWMCAVFQNGCDGMQYCSYGGFRSVRFYWLRLLGFRLPAPLPFFEYGHFWMGVYAILYLAMPIYLLLFRWRLHMRIWNRLTTGFRRPRIRNVKTGHRIGGGNGSGTKNKRR